MTPGARAAAAILVLDEWLAGTPAELALTRWARGARYAGSSDRAAIRDLVYAAIRCRRSLAMLGGSDSGRGLILGNCRAEGIDPETIFGTGGHAPVALSDTERQAGVAPEGWAAADLPDWLGPLFARALGPDTVAVAQALRHRAPVFLRVNAALGTPDDARRALAAEGITAAPHPLADTALEVTAGQRRIEASEAYRTGLVELQDASSQAVVSSLPLSDGMRVLDLCAGGGGKTLAMAARARLKLYAHDAVPGRMRDLAPRAARAGQRVRLSDRPEADGPFDLVLVDAPCSGSGSWRRDPEGKWRLTPARLAELADLQAAILDRAAGLVTPAGILAYATCSLLNVENDDQVTAYLARHTGWRLQSRQIWTPLDGGDGFFLALLSQK